MDRFIGIDLGTTYSAVSTIDQFGKPVILKNRTGEALTPSVIYFSPDGDILIGNEAKEMQASGESDVAMFFKRNMGNPDFFLTFHDKSYSATDLSSLLLKELRKDAEAALNTPVSKAVITVPAYFNDLQRTETIKAAEAAGLEVLRILNEPTSAAITYGIANMAQKVLVYDLGGGTFDVTVLSITDDSIKVLATGGDHELGGKDWDDKILGYMAEQFINEFGDDPMDDIETYNDLAFKSENLKKQLTSALNASFTITYNGYKGKYTLSRETFEELTKSLLYNTTFKANEILEEAGLTWAELNGVLLVGGSTKMPMVRNWVKEMSGKEPLTGINVDEAVCLGAAIQAQIETDRKEIKYAVGGSHSFQYSIAGGKNINDVMSHSLGLVAVNATNDKYINSIIIPKNKTIPSSESRPFQFKTAATDQTNELEVYLTQGEVEDVSQCIIVGKYVFNGIEHIARGKTIIDIEYQYDANGVISIIGKQRETGRELIAQKYPLPDDINWLYEKPVFNIPHLSVTLAIDISGSMGGNPLMKAMEAARNFTNNIDLTNASVGIVAFSNTEKELCPLTQNSKKINNGIKDIQVAYSKWGSGTSGKPLDLCYDILRSRKGLRYIVVLTDGVWTKKQEAIDRSRICRQEGIEIIAIGLGSVNRSFLEAIATSTENAFLTDINSLVSSFGNIAQVLTESGSMKMI